jgi:Flp pilus assembly protein TadD
LWKNGLESVPVPVVLAMVLASLGVATLHAGGPATLQGKVLDEQGAPLAGVQIVITTSDSSLPIEAKTRKKGTFAARIPDRSGQYTVECRLPGYADHVEVIGPNLKEHAFIHVTMSAMPEQAPAAVPEVEARPVQTPDETRPSEQRRAAIPVFNEGVTALQAEDLEAARLKFLEAAELDPDFPEVYRALAVVGVESDDYTLAAKASEELLRLEPQDIQAMSTSYFALAMLGDLERLGPAARRLGQADPSLVEGEMLPYARHLFEENKFKVAEMLCESIIDVRPDLADAYYLLGLCRNTMGDTEGAAVAFEEFVRVAPDHPDAESARSLLEFLK